jgi:hypothetical protein
MIGDVAVFLLMSLSLSQMFSFSEVFLPIRNFIVKIPYIRKPLLCPECCSFWMGILTSAMFNPFFDMFDAYHILSTLFCGLVTHLAACYLYKIYFKLHT